MFGITKQDGTYSVEIGNSTTITTKSLWLAIETKILGWQSLGYVSDPYATIKIYKEKDRK